MMRFLRNILNVTKNVVNDSRATHWYQYVEASRKLKTLNSKVQVTPEDEEEKSRLSHVIQSSVTDYKYMSTNQEILCQCIEDMTPQSETRLNSKEKDLHQSWQAYHYCKDTLEEIAKQTQPSDLDALEWQYDTINEMTNYERNIFVSVWKKRQTEQINGLQTICNNLLPNIKKLQLNKFLLERLNEHGVVSYEKSQPMVKAKELLRQQLPIRNFDENDASTLALYLDCLSAAKAATAIMNGPSKQAVKNMTPLEQNAFISNYPTEHKKCLKKYNDMIDDYLSNAEEKMNEEHYREFVMKHANSDQFNNYYKHKSKFVNTIRCHCTPIIKSPTRLANEDSTDEESNDDLEVDDSSEDTEVTFKSPQPVVDIQTHDSSENTEVTSRSPQAVGDINTPNDSPKA